ncbi:class I SAM-dependent methyltransferase [Lysinibacillus sp. SGAir0095]|uniref:class I SAM-dependent DNA methyltransferase n=1 Tax=Lysinibacillus sp. SGAir0095 TaxID=2070463 RepID=UPI0010CD1138|nr:class I SAM-dependent methyltransferase [Lysinibacillus sp. SGAir0095]QCR32953.1 SAM-dependent methyltransferase [Lysinibacillus sp. SGAir0095]
MNSSYERFAIVYDQLMQDIPYDQYVNWVKTNAPNEQYPRLLDIGCGTGTLSLFFHQEGYEVSGIDLSEDMLAVAYERLQTQGATIPLFTMSMDELEGFSNLDVVTIPIDSINYVVNQDAVIETLKRIYSSLRQGGQLFFDVHSLFKMDHIFMESPFTYDDGEITYLWYTEPGEFEHSIYHQMTFFLKEESGLFERFDEEHYQRTFAVDMYVNWLKEIGFTHVEVTADWSEDSPAEESERIFFRAIK